MLWHVYLVHEDQCVRGDRQRRQHTHLHKYIHVWL